MIKKGDEEQKQIKCSSACNHTWKGIVPLASKALRWQVWSSFLSIPSLLSGTPGSLNSTMQMRKALRNSREISRRNQSPEWSRDTWTAHLGRCYETERKKKKKKKELIYPLNCFSTGSPSYINWAFCFNRYRNKPAIICRIMRKLHRKPKETDRQSIRHDKTAQQIAESTYFLTLVFSTWKIQ